MTWHQVNWKMKTQNSCFDSKWYKLPAFEINGITIYASKTAPERICTASVSPSISSWILSWRNSKCSIWCNKCNKLNDYLKFFNFGAQIYETGKLQIILNVRSRKRNKCQNEIENFDPLDIRNLAQTFRWYLFFRKPKSHMRRGPLFPLARSFSNRRSCHLINRWNN